jgi:hypothetical protein
MRISKDDCRNTMNVSRVACVTLLVFLITINAISKVVTVDIYALVEKVVLEPNDVAPESIQIWGALAFDRPGDWKFPGLGRVQGHPPNERRRGYLYFRLCRVKKEARMLRSGWNELKALAGSGQAVEFDRIRVVLRDGAKSE